MAKLESAENDEAQLIEAKPTETVIRVEENPPPYQRLEVGKRVYPAKRVYAWLCARGNQPYSQLDPPARSAPGGTGQRWSGATVFLVAIPMILLMALATYFVTMLIWCPNCRHHSRVYVHNMETQIQRPQADRTEGKPSQSHETNGEQEKIEETPQQPIMFGPMSFLARRRQELLDRIRQSQSQQSAPAPHLVRRVFFFIHPKKEMAERPDGLKDEASGSGEEETVDSQPMIKIFPNIGEDVDNETSGTNVPSGIISSMLGTAENIFSKFRSLFAPPPSPEEIAEKHERHEEASKKEEQPEESAKKEEAEKEEAKKEEAKKEEANLPKKTVKIEENGKMVGDIDVDKLIDAAVARKQAGKKRENVAEKNGEQAIASGEKPKADEKAAAAPKSVEDSFKTAIEDETDPFIFKTS